MGLEMTDELRRARLIVIEDDPDLREILGYILEREGFEVEIFSSSERALERMHDSEGPLVVLSEVMLPFVRGEDILAAVRSLDEKRIGVIFLSSRTQEKVAVRMLELGADDFVRRPVYPRELVARIRNVMGRMK